MDAISSTAREEGKTSGQESVFSQLKAIIEEVIGADAVELIEITEDSAFIDDLEMDSIQIVQLAELVNDRYGEQVDFITWLSQVPLTEILKLKVGDIAGFIEKNLHGGTGADGAGADGEAGDAV
jgi:acyl carrier protein